MASSSNRKLSSSASKPSKPTFRRAGRASSSGSTRGASFQRKAPSVPKAQTSAARKPAASLKPKKAASKPRGLSKPVGTSPKQKASVGPRTPSKGKAGISSSGPAAPSRLKRSGAQPKLLNILKASKAAQAPGNSGPAASSGKKGSGAAPRNPVARAAGRVLGAAALPFRAVGRVVQGALTGKIIAIAVAVALVLAVGSIVVVNGPFFAATDVQFEGSAHLSAENARKTMSIPDGTTLLNVNEDAIAQSVGGNPWISGVSVERRFPHTLVITPQERSVSAIVYISADDVAWAVGDDQTWIAPVSLSVTVDAGGAIVDDAAEVPESSSSPKSDEGASDGSPDAATQGDAASGDASDGEPASDGEGSDAADASDAAASSDGTTTLTGIDAAKVLARSYGAVLFTDLPADINPSSGKAVDSDIVKAGLAYAQGFSSSFLQQIDYISLASEDAISAFLTSGVEVALGAPDDIEAKEIVITRLLEQQQGVTYINVRTPDHYTFRSAPDA